MNSVATSPPSSTLTGRDALPRIPASPAPCAPRRAACALTFLIFNFSFLILLPSSSPAATDPGNAYGAIVGRNVFGLKPPTPVSTTTEEPKVPAPKIRLQGLTTILGRRQVLFKVLLPARPGEPPKEQASVLSEGQREGEIEVLEINEITGTVKFNNYGYPQTLNMKDDADKPTPGPPPAGVPQPGVVPQPGMTGLPAPTPFSSPPPGVPKPMTGNIPTRSLRTTPDGASAGAGMAGGIPGIPGLNTAAQPTAPAGPPLSHEEQEVMIEVKRQLYKDQGDPLRARIMPPTSMTPPKETAPSPQP